MKKLFLTLIVSISILSLNAQEQGKIRVGLDAGLGIPNLGVGFNGNLDIRYNVMDNFNVGVKFNPGIFIKDVVADEVDMEAAATFSTITSTLVTSDYYFNNGSSSFAPYLGGGLGLFKIVNVGFSQSGTDNISSVSVDVSDFMFESKFGGLIRGGFEIGHFRMGLEYYLIPRTKLIDIITNTPTGTTANSFLNFTVGFYLGGGRWKK